MNKYFDVTVIVKGKGGALVRFTRVLSAESRDAAIMETYRIAKVLGYKAVNA